MNFLFMLLSGAVAACSVISGYWLLRELALAGRVDIALLLGTILGGILAWAFWALHLGVRDRGSDFLREWAGTKPHRERDQKGGSRRHVKIPRDPKGQT